MVLAAATKALKKAELVKERMLMTQDLLTDNNAWILQQQLLKEYQHVLVLDLEYALDQKVEQDLWNHGFKNYIATLQAVVKEKKHPKRSEGQAMLHWCLEAASGFYLCLLQEISALFDLDLPFRRKGIIYGCTKKCCAIANDRLPNKCSSLYICQYCLVHLGDIARYRNQNRQAETFYKYAVTLSPTSGQPYNQLAIVEASRGDKLSMVYYYVRAVALSHPFHAAATNLSRALDKHAEDPVKLEGNFKLSCYEYLGAFLKLHGLLINHTDLDSAEKLVNLLTTSLTAHIATESLSAWKLVQIVVINIFALERVRGKDISKDGSGDNLTMTESRIMDLITQYIVGCLNAFLLPVYTIKCENAIIEYFAMSPIWLTLEWIRMDPQVLETSAFQNRMQIWPSLCRLLNQLQRAIKDFPQDKFQHVPLPEERDLQGFLPFESSFKDLKFHKDDLKTDIVSLNKVRATRVVAFGNWLAARSPPSLITSSHTNEGVVFEPVGRPDPPCEILKELELLTLGKLMSPISCEGGESQTGASTPDSGSFLNSCLNTEKAPVLPDKRPGILKNESIEKSETKASSTGRAVRNVALATIMSQKLNDDVKQVTFKTPSPISKEKGQKASPVHKKAQIPLKQNKIIRDSKENNKEKTSNKSRIETVGKTNDSTLLQQKKLMEVLAKDTEKKEDKENKIFIDNKNFPPLKDKPKVPDSVKLEETQQKQQLLSVLFDDSKKTAEQPKVMSGLLNLSKHQQEILTNSKQKEIQMNNKAAAKSHQQNMTRLINNVSAPSPPQQKVVDKMEAARKEYEDAMFVLQQRKQEQAEQMRFQERETYGFERLMQPMPPQQPSGPPIFLPMNPPVMAMQPFAFKYQSEVMLPWQGPEQPPMPPTSWWSDRPPPPHPRMMPEPPGYSQPARPAGSFPQLSTYSLFSNPMSVEADANYHNNMPGRLLNQQSFWTGPGPSPLERLLEQQRKQMRDGHPNT